MSWSYSGNPSYSKRDQVRFYMQDTDPSLQLLQDEEIDFLLTEWELAEDAPLFIAALGCEIVAGKFAREIDVSADGVSVSTGQLQQRYRDLAASLRAQFMEQNKAGTADLMVAAFGVGWDPTIKPLNFGVGFNDNYEAGRQEYGEYHPGESVYYYPEWLG